MAGVEALELGQDLGDDHVAEAHPHGRAGGAGHVAEQIIVAAAAEDGAKAARGVEALEDGAGVIREPAHYAGIEAQVVGEAHRGRQFEQPAHVPGSGTGGQRPG